MQSLHQCLCAVGIIFPVFCDFLAFAYILLFYLFIYLFIFYSIITVILVLNASCGTGITFYFGGGVGVGVGSMCSVYAIFEQLLTWLLQLYFSEVLGKAVFSMMSKIPELKHSLHLTLYKSIWRLPLSVQDGYCNRNLQLPCVLFVGSAYHYFPATAFNIFSQHIYLLNFFNILHSLFFLHRMLCIS